MEREVIILKHVANEGAGTLLDYMNQHRIRFHTVDLFKPGVRLPDLNHARCLLVMGGPMNVYEENVYPFLKEENTYIQEALQRKVPFLGICLGAQLLAKALDAKVYKAAKPELGWSELTLLEAARTDRVLGGGGPPGRPHTKLKVLQWHEDTFDLPLGAVHLASSAEVPNQAYAVQGLFYGFQFHIEVNRPQLEDWFKGRRDLRDILTEYDAYKNELSEITDRLYKNFFSFNSHKVPA